MDLNYFERTYGLSRRDKHGRTLKDYLKNPYLIDRIEERSSSETERSQERQKQQKRKQL